MNKLLLDLQLLDLIQILFLVINDCVGLQITSDCVHFTSRIRERVEPQYNIQHMNSEPSDRIFWISKEDEIKQGKTTDVYFVYTRDILKSMNKNPRVIIEVFARSVEDDWGVVTGIYEVSKLFQGMNVNVRAMEEGEIFQSPKESPIYEPVMQIEANYADIAIFENPILGFLCFSSGVSSKAAKIRRADDKTIFSFGTRR